jgi:hypothetical protein
MARLLLHSKAASLMVAATDNITSHQHKSNSWFVSYIMIRISISFYICIWTMMTCNLGVDGA